MSNFCFLFQSYRRNFFQSREKIVGIACKTVSVKKILNENYSVRGCQKNLAHFLEIYWNGAQAFLLFFTFIFWSFLAFTLKNFDLLTNRAEFRLEGHTLCWTVRSIKYFYEEEEEEERYSKSNNVKIRWFIIKKRRANNTKKKKSSIDALLKKFISKQQITKCYITCAILHLPSVECSNLQQPCSHNFNLNW
jgi:hypothetical protein